MEFKQRVKEAADIAQVIGEVVRLKPLGPDRMIGLCPFHQEKTPSFNVHRDQQFYYCFGCQKGGDVFKFVEEFEGVSFFEALKSLAERFGIPLPRRDDFDDETSRERAALLAMQAIALRHFRGSLSAEARRYLETRNVDRSAIEDFELGYAPAGSTLSRLLEREGFSRTQLVASGLVIERDDGSLGDRFRNRLMFPIHNEQGKVIAFGGRAMGEDQPKYLNSSDTRLYTKKRILFNLHRAKETIRRLEYTILVEGYLDVIGLAQAGIRNVVASCGTALSEDHVRALKRHADRIVINFDPDSAGLNAAERSIRMLLEESMKIRVLTLDGGRDPDEYVTQEGVEAYHRKIESAENYFHWLAGRARARFDMRSAEGRMEGFRELLRPALERVPDKLERLAVVNDLAVYLGVDARAILDQIKKSETAPARPGSSASPLPLPEALLIRGLLDNPAAAPVASARLEPLESWRRMSSAKILRAAFALGSQQALSYEALDARLEESDRRVLAGVMFADKANAAVSEQQLNACIESLEASDTLQKSNRLRDEIRALERDGKFEEAFARMRSLPGDKLAGA